jgi:hypothetical protein
MLETIEYISHELFRVLGRVGVHFHISVGVTPEQPQDGSDTDGFDNVIDETAGRDN